VQVIVTAEIPTPLGYVFRRPGSLATRLRAGLSPGGGVLRSPCLAYVVEHPRAGTILVDTGLHRDAATSLRRDFGLPMSLLFRSLKPASEPFDDQLRRLGIDPAGVERVVMTHLHVDHTSGMRLLPSARFTCTPQEWQAAHARFAARGGFVSHHLPPSSNVDLIDLRAEGEPYGAFKNTVDLLGDGSIRLLFTPGHTPGHQSVLLRLTDGAQVLLVGDAAYTRRSIDEQLLPMLTVDDELYRRSLQQLKAFVDGEPEAIVVPTHDPDAWRQLPAAEPAGRP
jgi:glyoxylase-like metal-dependent hydrolase (beta-lactamase superfamily II)